MFILIVDKALTVSGLTNKQVGLCVSLRVCFLLLLLLPPPPPPHPLLLSDLKRPEKEIETEAEVSERERERERDNSNSKTLFSKDCSLGLFRPV